MTDLDLQTATVAVPFGARPRDSELDLFGLTHRGKVRRDNQDTFLLATVHPQVVVHGTNLPDAAAFHVQGERLATIMLVADGVGGSVSGSEASRLATETVARYVSSALRCCHAADPLAERAFLAKLREAALDAHTAVLADGAADPERKGMATTLTLALAIWPWAYVVQVGDSRLYVFADGALRQITRDQTIAQDLVDRGALAPEEAATSPFGSVLSSAIGGGEATPEVTVLDIALRGTLLFLCSDGLTKHVTDAEIAEHAGTMTTSEQLCRTLLNLALERGGTDNITIVAGRAVATAR